MEISLRKYFIHTSLAITEIQLVNYLVPCSVRPCPPLARPFNAVRIWKRRFNSHRTSIKCFPSTQSQVILDLCLRKTRERKSRDYITRSYVVFEKFRFHENAKPAFSNPSGLNRVFEKFSWRINVNNRPNRRNKAAFWNFYPDVWTLPKKIMHTWYLEKLQVLLLENTRMPIAIWFRM